MLNYFETLTDDSGNSLLGATVQALTYPGGTPASIFNTNGIASPVANSTVASDVTGQVSFYAPDGAYTLVYTYQGTVYKTKSPVQMFDPLAFVSISDSGTANSYAITSQALSSGLYVGLKAEFKAANSNTGASTFNFNNTGAQALVFPGGLPLSLGVIQAGGLVRCEWDGAEWQVNSTVPPEQTYVETAGEIAASVTVVNFAVAPGNVNRYGINTTPGTTDMSTAINAAIAQAGNAGVDVLIPAGTYYTTKTLGGPYGNLKIQIDPGALVTAGANSISIFAFTQQTGVEISGGGTLQYSTLGTTFYIAGVQFTNCTLCRAINLRFSQMQYHGVWLLSSSQCEVRGNQFYSFLGGLVDQADVAVMSSVVGNPSVNPNTSPLGGTSDYNLVCDNWLFGGGEHAVLLQDPYTAGGPYPCRRNVISGNRCGAHNGYGIAVYQPGQVATFTATISTTALSVTGSLVGTISVGQRIVNAATGALYGNAISGSGSSWVLDASNTVASPTSMIAAQALDTFNEITDNSIEGITGSQASNPSSGAGIYVVGVAAGGTLMRDNAITNCCSATANSSLGAGGIVISDVIDGSTVPLTGPIVAGNAINGMTQGNGITIVGCNCGVVVGPNTVNIPATNNGSGPGGSALTGAGLLIENSNGTTVAGGHYRNFGTGSGLFIYANGVNQSDITVAGGKYFSASAASVLVNQNGGVSNIGVRLTGVASKNSGTGGSAYALQWSDGTQSSVAGGSYTTAGSVAVTINGTNTGSFMDAACYWGAANSLMVNGGGGFNVRFRGASTPQGGGGTFAVGDICENTAPASTGVLEWACTTAGSAGTWTGSVLP